MLKLNKKLMFVLDFALIVMSMQMSTTAQAGVTATASSVEKPELGPEKAVDGNKGSRWSSEGLDNQWIEFDLGQTKELVGAALYWEAAFGEKYDILVSEDNKNWKVIFSQDNGAGGIEDIDFEKTPARYVRLALKKRGTGWGFSLFEVVIKTADEPFGIGLAEPNAILKMNWRFSANPQKTIYIPKSWEGAKVVFLAGAITEEYTLSIDGKEAATVKNLKKPARLDITEYITPGVPNLFSVKPKEGSTGEGVLKSLLLAKNSESDKLSELRKSSPMDYYRLLADLYSEGYFPVWLNNKQDYWTIVGTEDSYEESLISSKGIIGAYTLSFSLMPFLYINDELVTFADAKIDLSLEENYLPIPTVKWTYKGVDFTQKFFACAKEGKSATYVIYKLKNNTAEKIKGKLFLSIRPFEVNPPWMHGGLTKITSIAISEDSKVIKINNRRGIISLTKPDGFGSSPYEQGDIITSLIEGKLPAQQSIEDASGHASASLAYNFELSPNKESEYLFVIPVDADINNFAIPAKGQFFKNYELTKREWKEKLNRIEINIPEEKVVNTLRSNIAYILINKDGPSLQPGSRSYERAWVRDGALIAAALLRTSYPEVSKKFVEWMAKAQTSTGEIPCIIEPKTGQIAGYARNWLEYDAPGEFVFSVADYYNFTNDSTFVKEMFSTVEKQLKILERLRAQMLDEKYKGTHSYGILPKSHSHEGYLDNPQQSLWDDFWGLKGWKDAQVLAKVAEREDLIPWMSKEETDFRKCLLEDIKLVQAEKKFRYIPSSIGLAEIDAISVAIVFFPTGEYQYLDRDQIYYTMNRYYNDEFRRRIDKGIVSTYIPYEMRAMNAFLMLDEREKALEMVRYFLKDLRPKEWNHWAEVVPANPSAPMYVGDMPHSWIGAIYINALRNMFVYEENDALILGAGIDEKWLDRAEGMSVKNLPVYSGTISYSVRKEGNALRIKVSGDAIPPKGFVFRFPLLHKKIADVKVNNNQWNDFTERAVSFKTLPVDIALTTK